MSPTGTRHRKRSRAAVATACVFLLAALTGSASPAGASAANTGDWLGYLYGPDHSSYSPSATAITPANASSMAPVWNWMPGAPPIASLGHILYASPTVFNGVVYIGANNGTFYALNESTGAIVWQRFFGYTSRLTCPGKPEGAYGFVATATVADAPGNGAPTLYINSPDGYLYALNPSSGATVWRAIVGIPSKVQNSFFPYSSPTVSDDHIYVGISSQCNHPWVHGGVAAYDQNTGSQTGVFYNVPPGALGASTWSSVAVEVDGTVIETTGSGPVFDQYLGNAESIVALTGTTLQEISAWQIPHPAALDSDFGASPTLFSAVLPGGTTPVGMVGACSKDGTYYALQAGDLSAGPVWSFQIASNGSECISAAAWNGQNLFFATPRTMVNGTLEPGTIREIDPATGATVWITALPSQVWGAVSLDGSGVLAVATYGTSGPQGIYLVDATTGALLTSNSLTGTGPCSGEFAQPVFVDSYLLSATLGCGLTAYSPSTSG